MSSQVDISKYRKPEYPVQPMILRRWSPRALSGEEISREELMSLFEAARWAPSAYNGQPWRFFYARRNRPHWDDFVDLMVEFNQTWAQHAAVLIVIVSRTTFEHNNKPAATHSFDTGAAWQNLALEASAMGLVAHAMQGFDYEKAHRLLELPQDWSVEAMVAVGRSGRKEDLPEAMQEKEEPSGRKPISEIAFEGKYRTGS